MSRSFTLEIPTWMVIYGEEIVINTMSLMCVEMISGPFAFEASCWVVRKSVGMKLSDGGV